MAKGRVIGKRLERGDDVLKEIKKLEKQEQLEAEIVLSSVGCVYQVRVSEASGVTIQERKENGEIIDLNGNISVRRTHLHIGFAKQGLSMIGGHLVEGCLFITTCELVLQELDQYSQGKEEDILNGNDELVYNRQ